MLGNILPLKERTTSNFHHRGPPRTSTLHEAPVNRPAQVECHFECNHDIRSNSIRFELCPGSRDLVQMSARRLHECPSGRLRAAIQITQSSPKISGLANL